MGDGTPADRLAISFVPGVTLTKWTRIWKERRPDVPLTVTEVAEDEQLAALHDGSVDLAFVRLPVDANDLNVIPLYREIAVAVAAKDHSIAAADSLVLADLAGESMRSGSTFGRADFDLVAAGVGILVMPHSIARLQSHRDLVSRPVTDVAETQIAVAWRTAPQSDPAASLIEEFIGIVRGRTARSSRSTAKPDDTPTGKTKRSGKAQAASTVKSKPGKPSGAAFAQQRKNAAARKKRRGR